MTSSVSLVIHLFPASDSLCLSSDAASLFFVTPFVSSFCWLPHTESTPNPHPVMLGEGRADGELNTQSTPNPHPIHTQSTPNPHPIHTQSPLLSCVVLSCLVLSCLVLCCLVLSCLGDREEGAVGTRGCGTSTSAPDPSEQQARLSSQRACFLVAGSCGGESFLIKLTRFAC